MNRKPGIMSSWWQWLLMLALSGIICGLVIVVRLVVRTLFIP